jgi:hypothetical protein
MKTKLALTIAPLFLVPMIARAAPTPTPTPNPTSTSTSTPTPTPTLSDSLTGDAKADYEAAKVYFGDKDYEHAYLKFQAAYDKSKDARLLWNMAACQKELRKYAKTIPLVQRYIQESGDKLSAQDRAEADALLTALKPGTTTVRVEVSETDADVTLDDEQLGKSPLAAPVLVDLGTHKLRVKKTGYDDFEQTLNAGGEALAVAVKLTHTVHEGTLFVRAGTNDTISLDGHVVGEGVYNGKLPSGPHVLRVSAPGMRPYQGDVVVSDNETREVPITLDRAETKVVVPTWVWYTLAGVAVAAGSAAVVVYATTQHPTYDGPHGNLPPDGTLTIGSHPVGFRF